LLIYPGHVYAVVLLLLNGADINMRDQQQHTPLMRVCALNQSSVASALINGKADISLRDSSGLTACDIAIASDARECVSLLEKATNVQISRAQGTVKPANAALIAHRRSGGHKRNISSFF